MTNEEFVEEISAEMSWEEMDRLMKDDTFSEFKSYEVEFRKFWLEWFERHHEEMANRFKANYYALVKLAQTLRAKETLNNLTMPRYSRGS